MKLKTYGETDFITGLRAIAVLLVVMIHSGGAGLRDFGVIGNGLADFGRTGVYMFFVISGFSVSQSYENTGSYGAYLRKRFWRIAPLYYCWITWAAYSLWVGHGPEWRNELGGAVDAYNLIMHYVFLSWLDYRIANSLLSVEWSLPIEMFWYILLPSILVFTKSRLASLGILLISVVVYWLIWAILPVLLPFGQFNNIAVHYSALPYFTAYAAGIVAYRWRDHVQSSKGLLRLVWGALVVVLMVIGYRIIEGIDFRWFGDFLQVSILTGLLLIALHPRQRATAWLLTNRLVLLVGTVSYGIYLCHVPVLGMVAVSMPAGGPGIFLATIALSTLIAIATYVLIERPGIRFGHRARLARV